MANHTPRFLNKLFTKWKQSLQGQTWKTLFLVLQLHKKHRILCISFIIALTATTLALSAQALLLTVIVDSWQHGALPTMALWTLVECGLVCWTSLGGPLQSVYRCEVGYGILRDWQIRLFEQLTAYQPPRPLPDKLSDKKTLFTVSLQGQPSTSEGLNAIQNILQFVITTILLVGQPLRLLVIAGFIGVLIMSWRAWKVARQERDMSALDLENDKAKLSLLDEVLSPQGAMMCMRFEGVREETLQRFKGIVTEEFRLNILLILAGRWLFGMATFLSGEMRYIVYLAVAVFTVMFTGGKLRGDLTIGHLLTIIDLLVLLLDGGKDILNNMITLMGILGKYNKAAQELELPLPQIFSPTVIDEPEGMRYDIALTDVSFGYQEGKPVLSSVTCRIQEGKVVCIVGDNGAGKTTFAKGLLMTLLLEGEYTIGGYNASSLGEAFFQKRVGHMGQDPYFKRGTVRENLTINAPADLDPELFAQAMQQHGIPEDKWDVKIDKDGSPLSNGQRQKAMGARVSPKLAPDYRIVVMDEPTNHTDEKGIALLINNIRSMVHNGRTVIIITHDKPFVTKLGDLSPRVLTLGASSSGTSTIVGEMSFQEYIR